MQFFGFLIVCVTLCWLTTGCLSLLYDLGRRWGTTSSLRTDDQSMRHIRTLRYLPLIISATSSLLGGSIGSEFVQSMLPVCTCYINADPVQNVPDRRYHCKRGRILPRIVPGIPLWTATSRSKWHRTVIHALRFRDARGERFGERRARPRCDTKQCFHTTPHTQRLGCSISIFLSHVLENPVVSSTHLGCEACMNESINLNRPIKWTLDEIAHGA